MGVAVVEAVAEAENDPGPVPAQEGGEALEGGAAVVGGQEPAATCGMAGALLQMQVGDCEQAPRRPRRGRRPDRRRAAPRRG